jgi:hypothetical protein
MYRFLLSFLLFSVCLTAQQSLEYVDRVDVRGAPNLSGRLIGYAYGDSVTLVDFSGEVHTVGWPDIRRVYFEYERWVQLPDANSEPSTRVRIDQPDRPWRHYLTLRAGGASERFEDPFFFGRVTRPTYGLGVSYHYLRRWGKLEGGPGAAYDLMSSRRKEQLLALTALVRYTIGQWRVRPVASLALGATLPLGSESFGLERRGIGHLIHPGLGAVVTPGEGQWGEIGLHLGYRISAVEFTGTNANLEVIERDITYRRLTISATVGF